MADSTSINDQPVSGSQPANTFGSVPAEPAPVMPDVNSNPVQPATTNQPSGSFVIPDIQPVKMVVETVPNEPVALPSDMPLGVPQVTRIDENNIPNPPLSSTPATGEAASLPPQTNLNVESGLQTQSSATPTQLPETPTPALSLDSTFPLGNMPPDTLPTPVDNIVVPSVPENSQFIPQGLQPNIQGPGDDPTNTMAAQPQTKSKGGGLLKKLLLVLIILIILAGIGVGVFLGLNTVSGNKEVTLTYWGLWENEAIMAPVIAEFEQQNPKIKVQYIKNSHLEYRARLQSAIERGDGPDVFRFHQTWIPMLKDDIQPIPDSVMSPQEFTTAFYKVSAQDLLAGSTLWGIPIGIDGLGLYINENLFSAAGVLPPTTYEELLSIVPRLTVKDGERIVTSAIALGTSTNIEHFSDIVSLMILQNGGSLSNPTVKETEEAVSFYRKFATPGDPMYTWNSLLDNSLSAFANGRLAMMIAPSWRAFDVAAINPNLKFKIEPVPQLPGTSVTWASYWVEGVSSKSKNQKQAMQFLKFLTSKESVTKMYSEAANTRLFGEPYARVELGSSLVSDQFVGAYIKQAQTAQSFPIASKTHDGGLNDRMVKYMEDAITAMENNTAPSKALSTMAQGFSQVLGTYGLQSAPAAP